jgi:glycerol uptake facilitator protein
MFALIAGWGKIAFPGDYGNVNTYFWIPIVGPLIGGPIGAYIYDFAVRDTLVARGETAPPDIEERGRTVEERPGVETRGGRTIRPQGRTVEER